MTHNNEGVGTLPLPNIPARPRIFVHERQVPANVRRRVPCCCVTYCAAFVLWCGGALSLSKNRTCPFIYFLSLPLLIRPRCITTDHCRHGFNVLSQARARCARVALFRSNHPQRRRQQDQMDLVQRAWANLPKRHRARCFGQLLVLECADGAR